jgi:hypothetical protein
VTLVASPAVAQLVHRHDIHPTVGSIHLADCPPAPERAGEGFLRRVEGRLSIGAGKHKSACDSVEVRLVKIVEC